MGIPVSHAGETRKAIARLSPAVAEVFVYGTLTDRDRAREVLGDRFRYGGTATLDGLRTVEGRYPTLAPPAGRDAGGGSGRDGAVDERPTVRGRLLWTDDLAALDAYEGVDRGLYVRATVPRADGGPVETYVGDPAALGVGDRVSWPGEGSLADRVRRTVATLDVVVRGDE